MRFPEIPMYQGFQAPGRFEADIQDLEVVQGEVPVLTENSLPGHADRDDRRAEFPADVGVGVGDELLRLGLAQPRPGHVEGRPGARGPDGLVEEPDVVVHPPGVLDRQGALLLEDDVVILTALNLFQRNA